MRNNFIRSKKGFQEQVPRAVVFALVFAVFVGLPIGTFAGMMRNVNHQTEDSFDNLVSEINELLESDEIYSYKENVPIYMGFKDNTFRKDEVYLIVFFDKQYYKFKSYYRSIYHFTEPKHPKDKKYLRPNECLNNNKCICLFKEASFNPEKFGIDNVIKQPLKCLNLDNEYKVFMKIEGKNDFSMESSRFIKRFLTEKNPPEYNYRSQESEVIINKMESFLLQESFNSDQIIDNMPEAYYESKYKDLFFISSTQKSVKNFYIDVLDLSKLNLDQPNFDLNQLGLSSNSKIIFILANQSLIDFHKKEYSKYIKKDPRIYSNLIKGSTKNINKLIYFKEYVDYINNTVIKGNEADKFNENLKRLDPEVFYNVFLALLDQDIVEGYPIMDTYSFKADESYCESDEVVNEDVCKELVKQYKNKPFIFRSEFVLYIKNYLSDKYFEKAYKVLSDKLYKIKEYDASFLALAQVVDEKYIGNPIDIDNPNEKYSYEPSNYLWSELSKPDNDLSIIREALKISREEFYIEARGVIETPKNDPPILPDDYDYYIISTKEFEGVNEDLHEYKFKYRKNDRELLFNIDGATTFDNNHIGVVSIISGEDSNKERVFVINQVYNKLRNEYSTIFTKSFKEVASVN